MRKRISALLGASALLVAATAGAQGVKWHPGHYVVLSGKATMEQHMREIEEIGDEHHIKGVMVRLWWSELEPRWYDWDFSRIDAYLNKLAEQSTTKRLVVRIMDRRFNTDSPEGIVPKYMRNDPRYNGGVVDNKTGYVARLWERVVMGRLIALYQALGSRYDSHPFFEGLFTEESTLSLDWRDYPEGYSNEALTEQYIRFVNEVKPYLPHSHLFMNANWIGSSELMGELIAALDDAHVAAGGSNVWVDNKTLGQAVLTGEHGTDYRWELPIAHAVEASELGGWLGDWTPSEIANYAFDEVQTHYLFWVRNTWQGDESQRWDTGILPYLRTNPPIRTRCPNTYDFCID